MDVLNDKDAIAPYIGRAALVFDLQFYHAVCNTNENAAETLASLLAPGGTLIIIAGNSSEGVASAGPTMLSKDQVVTPFTTAGLTLCHIETTRFDSTPTYGEIPPLAWCVEFRK